VNREPPGRERPRNLRGGCTAPEADERMLAACGIERDHEVVAALHLLEQSAQQARVGRGVVAGQHEQIDALDRHERSGDAGERPAPGRCCVLDCGEARRGVRRAGTDADHDAITQRRERRGRAFGQRAPAERQVALRTAEAPAEAAGEHETSRSIDHSVSRRGAASGARGSGCNHDLS
jgi:hypothetical protein